MAYLQSRMSEGDLTTKKLLGYNEDDEEDGKRFSLAGTSNAGSTALTDRFLALNPGDPSHTQSNAGTPRGKIVVAPKIVRRRHAQQGILTPYTAKSTPVFAMTHLMHCVPSLEGAQGSILVLQLHTRHSPCSARSHMRCADHRKSAKVSPGVNFADSHVPSPLGGKPATVSPFAVAQGVKVEPGKENGHHSEPGSFDTVDSNGNPQNGGSVPVAEESMPMLRDKPMVGGTWHGGGVGGLQLVMSPRGRSSNLAASNSAVPQEIAIDTEELLRVQNNHSPRTSGQPQPQVQPPRLSMPAP
eukprot:scaffold207497_cov21-Tisochrysis_lutea.AAC.1